MQRILKIFVSGLKHTHPRWELNELECGCSGRDLSFLNDRFNFEKRAECCWQALCCSRRWGLSRKPTLQLRTSFDIKSTAFLYKLLGATPHVGLYDQLENSDEKEAREDRARYHGKMRVRRWRMAIGFLRRDWPPSKNWLVNLFFFVNLPLTILNLLLDSHFLAIGIFYIYTLSLALFLGMLWSCGSPHLYPLDTTHWGSHHVVHDTGG